MIKLENHFGSLAELIEALDNIDTDDFGCQSLIEFVDDSDYHHRVEVLIDRYGRFSTGDGFAICLGDMILEDHDLLDMAISRYEQMRAQQKRPHQTITLRHKHLQFIPLSRNPNRLVAV